MLVVGPQVAVLTDNSTFLGCDDASPMKLYPVTRMQSDPVKGPEPLIQWQSVTSHKTQTFSTNGFGNFVYTSNKNSILHGIM